MELTLWVLAAVVTAFKARITKELDVPGVRPVTVNIVLVVVPTNVPADVYTLYPVIEVPPLSLGADHDRFTRPVGVPVGVVAVRL